MILLAILAAGPGAAAEADWAFAGWRRDPEAVEEFLRLAEVLAAEPIPVGISRSRKLTLRHGDVTAAAIFKTIDVYEPKIEFEDGSIEINFRDSWRNELAAYELDRRLELGLVPPTVERRLDGEPGALRLWIEGAMSEAERLERGARAPDPAAWSAEVAAVRLFFNLTANSDFNNIRNLLVDGGFRICAVDHSRAFGTKKKLVSEALLMRFPRRLLQRLEALDEAAVGASAGEWLSRAQIRALLKRRDLILERAGELVALKGEAAILLD